MRKLLLSLVAAAAIGGAFMPSNASAAPGSLPGIQPAIIDSNVVEDVQWRRRCWHRGYSRWWCRYGGGYGGHWRYGSRGGHWRWGSRRRW